MECSAAQAQGLDVARRFTPLGTTVFVLSYRLPAEGWANRQIVPLQDAQRAMRLIRAHATRFGIDPARLGVIGFSAGGHLASTVAIHFGSNFNLPTMDSVDQTDARPDFLGLGYPVISMDPNQFASSSSMKHLLFGYSGSTLSELEQYLSGQKQVTANTPPTFLFESFDDKVVNSENSSLFYQALVAASVPSEAHIFQMGTHGAGLATGDPVEGAWPELFRNWLFERGLFPKASKLVPQRDR